MVSEALGISRASLYRACSPTASSQEDAPKRERRSVRSLSACERQTALDTLHAERFQDCSVREVYATLLDEGRHLCSISTMYRLLRKEGETRERRDQCVHPAYRRPELLARGPNELWSWDITKLLGATKWTYYYLYVILDVYSRYVVGWTLSYREGAALAEAFISETCGKQRIAEGQLTLHADRGSAMTSKPVAFLLADLGVTKSHSRPHTSNDNPYSEAQFKTMKYRPAFPARFASMEEARLFCQRFFGWYNGVHHHSGIALLTPEVVHYGRAEQMMSERQETLTKAYKAHPERFVRQAPVPQMLPEAVWINPPMKEQEEQIEGEIL